MRDAFINKSLNLLKKQYTYDSDTLDKVKYGLESIYINVTKLSFIIIVSLIFHVFKYTLLFCLFINGLRTFAYGIHAKKSWHCYVSSTFCFILMPYIFSTFEIDTLSKVLISILSLTSMYLFAPADTVKRPIINPKQRKKLKLLSLIVCTIYTILIFIINNSLVCNMIILSMVTESMLINPFIYKIFNLPYDNYKEYLKRGV